MTFAPGDVVALKSGGQPMTVLALSEESAECIWIGEAGELFRESIPTLALSPALLDDEGPEDENAENQNGEEDGEEDEGEATSAAPRKRASAAA